MPPPSIALKRFPGQSRGTAVGHDDQLQNNGEGKQETPGRFGLGRALQMKEAMLTTIDATWASSRLGLVPAEQAREGPLQA